MRRPWITVESLPIFQDKNHLSPPRSTQTSPAR